MASAEKIAVVDCAISGIAGDMFVAALIDLGADEKRVVNGMESSALMLKGCDEFKVEVKDTLRNEVRAKSIEFLSKEKAAHRIGRDLIEAVEKAVESLNMSKKASKTALNSLYTLLKAESKIHGCKVEEVHLHEAGMAETVAEIVGACIGMESLSLFREDVKIYSTPVAIGGGRFEFSHGTFSSPAPATLQILTSKNFPLIGGPVQAELTTPTGASLLVNVVDEASPFYPPMRASKVGYGAGSREFRGLANVLRMVIGEPITYPLSVDEVYVLETNVDDLPGEIIGSIYDRLLAEGARDVYVTPVFGKKNRPGYIISAIVGKGDLERVSSLMIGETGTLGVRLAPYRRYVLAREVKKVKLTLFGEHEVSIRVKIARTIDGKVVNVKPEYDDLKDIAEETGKPLKSVQEEVIKEIREMFN